MNSARDQELDFARDIPFEQILTNPILDIAARFWEKDRYEAFKVCYRSMRRLDDLVDHRKESGLAISEEEADQICRMMSDWLELVRQGNLGENADPFLGQFLEKINEFVIPIWPWERLYKSMAYDIRHDGFASFLIFLRYTEGAAIAPASIFMHLLGVSRLNGKTNPPSYDIRLAARPLAIFSYLVHIIRDFQKDQISNLNYFADDLMTGAGVSRDELKKIAVDSKPTQSFRKLVAQYARLAEYYRGYARIMIDKIQPDLEDRYQLSLELIYQLYMQIFERIDPVNGTFTTAELNPSPSEVKDRIELTISEFVPSTG